MEFFPVQGVTDIVQWNEFYHYYLNTKYFRELGYTGLYDATVVADHEDDPDSFNPDQAVRSLVTYENTTRGAVLERAAAIRAAFPDDRWREFKSDIAVFRAAQPDEWRSSQRQQDHGYNGSPLVTLLLGTLARQPLVDTATFLRLAAWFDIALVLGAGAVLWAVAGAAEGALFLFLFAANPLNDFSTVGGAYLRYLHLLALLAMAVAYARRRYALAGGALALAIGLRVFPLYLAFGLAAKIVLGPGRRQLLREHARFFAALGIVLAVVVVASSFQPSPEGSNPWGPYVAKLGLHAQRLTYNVVSLQYPFFYGSDHNAAALIQAYQEGHPANWIVEANRAFAAHRGAWLGMLLFVFAGLALYVRSTTPADGLFAGLALVFVLLHVSHYDWCVLAIVPFLFPGRTDMLLALLAFFMAASISVFLPAAAAIVDLRFCILSLLTAAWFAAAMALSVLAARRDASAGAAARLSAPIGLL
jgi:hypothetical protein